MGIYLMGAECADLNPVLIHIYLIDLFVFFYSIQFFVRLD